MQRILDRVNAELSARPRVQLERARVVLARSGATALAACLLAAGAGVLLVGVTIVAVAAWWRA